MRVTVIAPDQAVFDGEADGSRRAENVIVFRSQINF